MSTAQERELDDSQDAAATADELLAAGATAEWRLLKQERRAEKRLANAIDELSRSEQRLRKAKERLEQSRAAVVAAETALGEAQARRATGPSVVSD
jgi:predicted ribosome quality control (RQC) complex YloA/Tae2 family protein